MSSLSITCVTIVLHLLNRIECLPNGVPTDACGSMKPGGPHEPNTVTDKEMENPPFSLTATKQGGKFKGEMNVTFSIFDKDKFF